MKNSAKTQLCIVTLSLLSSAVLSASHNKLVYIDQYDSNGDFAVSQREFNVVRHARFTFADVDKNGTVNIEEYTAEYSARLNTKMNEERLRSIKQALIRFDSLDKNDNRQVTWDEIAASGDSTFSHYDENQDGVINDKDAVASEFTSNNLSSNNDKKDSELSEEERQKQRERELASARRVLHMTSTHMRHGMMQKYDTDNDGVLTRADFDNFRKQEFKRTDSNGDGWINTEEYVGEFTVRLDDIVASTREKQIKQTSVRFEFLDRDGDGAMTFYEYQESGHKSFSRWDTDKDGYVSMDDPEPEVENVAQQ